MARRLRFSSFLSLFPLSSPRHFRCIRFQGYRFTTPLVHPTFTNVSPSRGPCGYAPRLTKTCSVTHRLRSRWLVFRQDTDSFAVFLLQAPLSDGEPMNRSSTIDEGLLLTKETSVSRISRALSLQLKFTRFAPISEYAMDQAESAFRDFDSQEFPGE